MALEDEIKAWREDDDRGYDSAIDLLCKAEEEIRLLRDPMYGVPESEEELSEATKARLQKGIDEIKKGNHSPFDPSELLDDDGRLPGQTIAFEKPAGVIVDVVILDQKTPPQSYRLLEHGYVNGYKVQLDRKNSKIFLEIDLDQVESDRIVDRLDPSEPLTWKFP